MEYRIIARVQGNPSSKALADQLHAVYSRNGVGGQFTISGEGRDKVVTFHRVIDEDIEYLYFRVQVSDKESDYAQAAVAQLIAELTCYDPPEEILPIISVLTSGAATVENIKKLMLRTYDLLEEND